MTQQSYGEPVAQDFDHVFRGSLVYAEQTPFQRMEIYEHAHFGRMLMLDGVVQTTERDEFCYHEMLVHPALCSRDEIGRVLVIGGGDGGTLRRVLDHGPRKAVMCEIDEAVTRASREHLPSISEGAFDDPRTTLLFDDGASYVARHPSEFDAILVDSTDPVGAAVVLFSEEFYRNCGRALRPGGVLVTQSGSPMYQSEELSRALRNMAGAFETVEVYTGFVPTYPGVLWSFSVGTDGEPISKTDPAGVRGRLRARGIETAFYTPDVHSKAFALPAFVKRAVDQATQRAAAATAPVPSG